MGVGIEALYYSPFGRFIVDGDEHILDGIPYTRLAKIAFRIDFSKALLNSSAQLRNASNFQRGNSKVAAMAHVGRGKKQRKELHLKWLLATREIGRGPRPKAIVETGLPAVVTLVQISGGKGFDGDGLLSAFKAFRDQVADELGLRDDRDGRVCWRYTHVKEKNAHAIAVEVRFVRPLAVIAKELIEEFTDPGLAQALADETFGMPQQDEFSLTGAAAIRRPTK